MRRVAITGLGTVNPLANQVSVFWEKALAGLSGIAQFTQFDTTAFRVHFGGEVRDLALRQNLDGVVDALLCLLNERIHIRSGERVLRVIGDCSN